MPRHVTPPDAARVLVLEETQRWLERLVIGLRLCPFASEPYEAGTVRFRVSEAESPDLLCRDLADELQLLVSAPRESVETTLLIHPFTLGDFPCFNDFLDIADACLRSMNLEGVIQIASFHPNYRFAGTEYGDVSNATNRSPYPMLHLLREESVAEALDHFEGDPGQIPRRNVRVLTELGWEGVRARVGTGRSS